MSTTRLWWVIGLMSTSLLGLIAYQWYWIDTVISGNEERFRQDVVESMHAVINKIEKQEALRLINQQIITQSFPQVTSVPGQVKKVSNQVPSDDGNTYFYASEDTADGASYEFFFSADGNMEGEFTITTQSGVRRLEFGPESNEQITTEQVEVIDNQTLEQMERAQIEEALEQIDNKSNFVVTILNDLIIPRNLGRRYDPKELDSLLRSEFSGRGINIDFEHAVIKPQSGRLVSLSSVDAQESILNSEFRAGMFPNDLVGEPSVLFVAFPGKEQYLMNKIWFTMSSSGLLILIILFCFAYAIYTIFRQKNISVMKSDFINNMTHEFKTPIATIGLAVEALQDKEIVRVPAMHDKYLGVIGDENKRLSLQVEKVLQMAILDRKELKLNLKVINAHEYIQAAIDKIGLQLEKREGDLNVALQAENDLLEVDETHFLNVVLNLLDNAIKYSEDAPQIMVRTQIFKGDFLLSIKDHGVGMRKEEVRHIFQKFYRVSTGDLHDVKGFGLGLAYVKNIVEEMNGKVEVESEVGKGTKFVIRLPLYHG